MTTTELQAENVLINRSELLQHLVELHNGGFGGFVQITDAACVKPKTNGLVNPDGSCRIRKRTYMSVQTGVNYENANNAHRQREGLEDREVGPLPWGEWLVPNKVIQHKGKLYYRYFPKRCISVQYYLDGKPVDKAEIAHYLKPTKKGDDIAVRSVKFENIVQVHADNKVIRVVE